MAAISCGDEGVARSFGFARGLVAGVLDVLADAGGRFASDELDRFDERGACEVLNHANRVAADTAAAAIEDPLPRIDREPIEAAAAWAGSHPFAARFLEPGA